MNQRKHILMLLFFFCATPAMVAMQDSRRIGRENRQTHRIALSQSKDQQKLFASHQKAFDSNSGILFPLLLNNKMLAVACIMLVLSQPALAGYCQGYGCNPVQQMEACQQQRINRRNGIAPGSMAEMFSEMHFQSNVIAENIRDNAIRRVIEANCLADKTCRDKFIEETKAHCRGNADCLNKVAEFEKAHQPK